MTKETTTEEGAKAERAVLPLPLQFLAAWIGVRLGRHQARMIEYLKAENRTLREQLGDKRVNLTDAQRRRLADLGKQLGRKGLAAVATIATPDTILRWYRNLVAEKYDGSDKRGQGRPRTRGEIVGLLVQMARENPGWGYGRLQGALKNLGYKIGRTTIHDILKEKGIDPAPRRTSWSTFLKAHMGAIVAGDFLTVEVLGLFSLVRYHVFFVIDIATRKVAIAGVTSNPNGRWMEQVAARLVATGGFLRGKRILILDRDPLYTKRFKAGLSARGVGVLRLPPRSPNMNAYAERFVLSIKSECLDRIVPLGEAHLTQVVQEYAKHYHHERNHQGIGNELIHRIDPANANGRITSRERVGGVLRYYHREAA